MRQTSSMPNLALPFGVVGASAGALFGCLLANPLVRELPDRARWYPAPIAAVAGALVGAYVRRRCARRPSIWETAGSSRVALLLALVGAGALTGAVVPCVTYGKGADPLSAGGLGVACAIAFYPVAALVLRAATRAERARLGSWVAASDRRAVWAILGTTLAMASMLGALEWPAAIDGGEAVPWLAPAMAAIAALGCLAAGLADRSLLRRLGGLEKASETRVPLDETDCDPDMRGAATVDVGLGEERHAEMAPGGAAYRVRQRAVSVLVGDVALARTLVRRSLVGAAVGLACCAGALGLHVLAGTLPALVAYREGRCGAGDVDACMRAADHHLREEALVSSPQRAAELLASACARRDDAACRLLWRMWRRNEATVDAETAMRVVHVICLREERDDCRSVTDLYLTREDDDRRAALRLLQPEYESACMGGNKRACYEAEVVRALRPNDERLPAVARCLRGSAADCRLAIEIGAAGTSTDGLEVDALQRLACAHSEERACGPDEWALRTRIP